jgi:hypothetical protein
MAELQAQLDEGLAKLKETEQRLFESEKARRHAHNALQDLKGKSSIQAYVCQGSSLNGSYIYQVILAMAPSRFSI